MKRSHIRTGIRVGTALCIIGGAASFATLTSGCEGEGGGLVNPTASQGQTNGGQTNGGQTNGGQTNGGGQTTPSIQLSASTIRLALTGGNIPATCTFTAVLQNPTTAAGTGGLQFTSSNPTVATVQSNSAGVVTLQGLTPGTTTITATDPASGQTAQVIVTVVANGVSDVLTGARTADGFVGTLVNAVLPTGTLTPPTVNNSTVNGTFGGTTSFTVGSAIPITDILIGIPGQQGYYDINVNGPTGTQGSTGAQGGGTTAVRSKTSRQLPSIIGGYQVQLNISGNLCQSQMGLAVELRDAAGNVTRPSFVTVNLSAASQTNRSK